jgi:hypothetical protein
MPRGSHLFLELFAYAKQANTHINIHHDLKDVKLWQVRIMPAPQKRAHACTYFDIISFLKQMNLMSMKLL